MHTLLNNLPDNIVNI